MYFLDDTQPLKIEETTFYELGMRESNIEEILRTNIDMLCDDEESMIIVGQQVQNEKNGRSDLTAIDNNGDLVLIEIKRDKRDIEIRKEAFEFQAIRYAASCATIKSTDMLIKSVFAPYLEKHKNEFKQYPELTSLEIAQRQLTDFIDKNNITAFNKHQRIILVASEFDEQTLAAVAWLNSNNVDISCYQILPYKFKENIIIDIKKILPIAEYEDFYVNVAKTGNLTRDRDKDITRRSLPKIDSLIEWQVVNAGDILIAKGTAEEAVLQKNGEVKLLDGTIKSIQQWLKSIYGWSSVQTYAFCIDKKTGKTLLNLREDYMKNHL